jgi:hypothetical protein
MNATILVLLMLAAGVVLVAFVAGMAAAFRIYSDDHGWWCGGDCDCRLARGRARDARDAAGTAVAQTIGRAGRD